jgi:alpha-mannosidase
MDMWMNLLSISAHAILFSYKEDFSLIRFKKNKLIKQSEHTIQTKLKSIARNVKPSKKSLSRIVVFNDQSWDREDIVKVYVVFTKPGIWDLEITDDKNKVVKHQITKWVPYADGSLSEGEIIFRAKIPSLGYNTYYISKSESKRQDSSNYYNVPNEIETCHFKIHFKKGEIEKIYFKPTEKTAVTSRGVKCNDILFYHAEPATDWRSGILNGTIDKVTCIDACLVEDGPIRKKIQLKGKIGDNVKVDREICIYNEIPRIDFFTNIHNSINDGTFRIQFPFTFKGKIISGIPFGAEKRDISKEPIIGVERDMVGYEDTFYAMGWLDYVSLDEEYGVSIFPLVNDRPSSGFRFHSEKNILELVLLTTETLPSTGWRSEINPKVEGHTPDNSAYSLFIHKGDWRRGEVYRRSLEYQNKLKPILLTGENHKPELPNQKSFLKIRPSNIVLSSLFCEDQKIIVRVYEQCGRSSNTELELPFKVKSAIKIDFNSHPLTENQEEITIKEKKISLKIKPWEIITLAIDV